MTKLLQIKDDLVNTYQRSLFFVATTTLLCVSTSLASISTLSDRNGSEDDAFATGQFRTDAGSTIANWSLSTSASSTDFVNDGIQVGEDGVQFVMLNQVGGSDDANRLVFSVDPLTATNNVGIVVSQSPYHNIETWNGGDTDIAQFEIDWDSGMGNAVLSDPLNQIANLSTGDFINPGSLIQFSSSRVFNSNDAWSIQLPAAANEVQVEWSSSNPAAGSTLTREWVTFDSFTTATAVPEPRLGLALVIGFLSCISMMRRR